VVLWIAPPLSGTRADSGEVVKFHVSGETRLALYPSP